MTFSPGSNRGAEHPSACLWRCLKRALLLAKFSPQKAQHVLVAMAVVANAGLTPVGVGGGVPCGDTAHVSGPPSELVFSSVPMVADCVLVLEMGDVTNQCMCLSFGHTRFRSTWLTSFGIRPQRFDFLCTAHGWRYAFRSDQLGGATSRLPSYSAPVGSG